MTRGWLMICPAAELDNLRHSETNPTRTWFHFVDIGVLPPSGPQVRKHQWKATDSTCRKA